MTNFLVRQNVRIRFTHNLKLARAAVYQDSINVAIVYLMKENTLLFHLNYTLCFI